MRYSDAEKIAYFIRQRAEAIKSLRDLGVTDLPGDAPAIQLATPTPAMREPAPALPWKPSWEMIAAARVALNDAGCRLTDYAIEAVLIKTLAVAPKTAPLPAQVGALPTEPTEEMVKAAVCMLRMTRDATGEDYTEMRMALNAALAVAPRAEFPEIADPDVPTFQLAFAECNETGGSIHLCYLAGLRAVRARCIERMQS